MGLYKEMLSFGVCVDHYTYNGLLTTMAHKHASLAQVEDLVREMSRCDVKSRVSALALLATGCVLPCEQRLLALALIETLGTSV